MRKIKLIATTLLASTLVMSGCGNDHQHTFKEEWSHDDETHWHEATCEHTDVKGSEGQHTDDNHDHKCDVCEFVMSECVDSNNDHKCDICGADLPYVSSVSISGAPETIFVGDEANLRANVQAHAGASNKVTWSVDKADLASIDENGKFTAKALGTVVVTATSVADASKKASVSIEIVARDWSEDDKETMRQYLGVALPYFEGDFDWSVDAQSGIMTASSSNAEDAAKVVEKYDELQFPKVVYDAYVEYTLPGAKEGFVVGVYVMSSESGSLVKAFAYRNAWPTAEIAEFVGDHSTDVIPSIEAEEYNVQLFEEDECLVIMPYGAQLNDYLVLLDDAGWEITDLMAQYGAYDCMSPSFNLEMVLFDMSDQEGFSEGEFAIQLYKNDVLPFPSEELDEFIGDWTEERLPVADGKNFAFGVDEEEGMCYVAVYGGDLAEYLDTLAGANFSIYDYTEEYGVYDVLSESHALDVIVLPVSETSYELHIYLSEPLSSEFPSAELAEFIGDYTEETVPAVETEGALFESFIPEESEIFVINACKANFEEYLGVLEGANYTIHEAFKEDGYIIATSEQWNLQLLLIDDGNGEFQIQVSKGTAPDTTEYPADAVNEFTSALTSETVVEPEGDAFDVYGYDEEYDCFALGVYYASALEYADKLADLGWIVDDSMYDLYQMFYGVGFLTATSPLGSLSLEIYDYGFQYELDIYAKELITEWPEAKIAEFCDGYTEVVIPEAEGNSYEVSKTDPEEDFYFGTIKVNGGDLDTYLGVLDTEGFNIVHDDFYDCETATKGDLALDLFESEGSFSIQAYTYVEPALEWPIDEIKAALDPSVTEEVPVPSAVGYVFNDFGDGSCSVALTNGNLAEYLVQLEAAGWEIDDSMYDLYEYYYGYGVYMAYSPEEQLTLYLLDTGVNYSIQIVGPEILPTAWSEKDVALMEEILGEEIVFFNGISSWSEYYGALEGEINSEEDVEGIIAALVSDGWLGGFDDEEYEYIYTKESTEQPGATLTAEIYSWYGYYYIDISVEKPEPVITEWPAAQIAEALGDKAKTTVPVCEGSSYDEMYFTDGYFSLFVYDADYDAYVLALTDAGFTKGDTRGSYVDYISADKTVVVTICNYGDGIGITGYSQNAPAPTEKTLLELVQECMGTSEDIPMPCDDAEAFSSTKDKDCTINVTGGDADAYAAALEAAGFEKDTFMSMAGYVTYVKGDISIDIDTTGGSTSNYKVYIYETIA